MKRSVKIIFTLSILLNLLLSGVIGGQAYKRYHDRPWDKVDLAPETRALMDKTFEEKRERIFTMIREMRQHKREVKDVITAETFDKAAFEKAVHDTEAFSDQMLEGKLTTFGDILEQLPQGERAKMANRVVDILIGSHGGKRGKQDKLRSDGAENAPPQSPPIKGDVPPPLPE